MLVRIAAAERAREAAEGRVAAAQEKAAALAAEVALLKARCTRLEADSWDPEAATTAPGVDDRARLESTREAMARIGAMIDELERREEMAAGIRTRTIEQMRHALAEADAPASPPVRPSPVIDVQPARPMRERMAEPKPFPTE